MRSQPWNKNSLSLTQQYVQQSQNVSTREKINVSRKTFRYRKPFQKKKKAIQVVIDEVEEGQIWGEIGGGGQNQHRERHELKAEVP